MTLLAQEFLHIFSSLLVASGIWLFFKPENNMLFLTFVAFALIGGFIIDFDHIIDYYIAFGFSFNMKYFLKGYQFIKNNRIILPLHSFELAIILVLVSFALKNIPIKANMLSFSLSLFLHLLIDSKLNKMTMKSYFFLYRLKHNFLVQSLVTKQHYKKHVELEKRIVKYLK